MPRSSRPRRSAPVTILGNRDVIERQERRVTSTSAPTPPQRIVASVRFESWRSAQTVAAFWLPTLAAVSSRSRLTLKTARFRPENIAAWAIATAMPSQIRMSCIVASEARIGPPIR
jgi:hypothetical protein